MTSQIPFPKGAKPIEIIETFSDGVWIEIPPRCCALGHTLNLNIIINKSSDTENTLTRQEVEGDIQVLGVVEELENTSEKRMIAKVKFRQFSPKAWQFLLDRFRSKQDQLNDLIGRTRK